MASRSRSKSARTEQPVELTEPVPVYLAYLTAVPSGGQIVFYEDIYGKDRSELAGSGQRAASPLASGGS